MTDKIVVPVTINGAGPFDFLVDTGDTDTIIDRKLAEELHLLSAGKIFFRRPREMRPHVSSIPIRFRCGEQPCAV